MMATTFEEPKTLTAALRRTWHLPLVVHAAAFLVLLGVVLISSMHPTSAYTTDEGVYALQAVELQRGRWTPEHQLVRYDVGGIDLPLLGSSQRVGESPVYSKHPLWPYILAASGSLFGNRLGFHLPSLVGAVGAASAAWCLAGALDRRAARPAFWLLAGGPLLAHSFLLWAHAPFAALSGFALVLALRVVQRRGGALTIIGCGTLLALGVLLRSEAAFFAAATGLVVALEVGRRSGIRSGAVAFVGLGLPCAVALYVERAWVSSILSSSLTAPVSPARSDSSSYVAQSASGATRSLLAGSYGGGAAAQVLALAALVVPVLAVLALRRGGPRHDIVIGAGIAAGLLVARLVLAPGEPIGGFLPAWPLIVAGLAVASGYLRQDLRRVLVRVSVLVLVAVLANQSAVGGGLDWGGRYLGGLWVPLAALAAGGLAARWDAWDPDVRAAATLAAVTLGSATAVVCVVAVASLRSDHASLAAAIESVGSPVAVSTIPSAPRLAWRTDDDVAWVLVEPRDLDQLTAELADSGEGVVTVIAWERPSGAGFSVVEPVGDAVWALTNPSD